MNISDAYQKAHEEWMDMDEGHVAVLLDERELAFQDFHDWVIDKIDEHQEKIRAWRETMGITSEARNQFIASEVVLRRRYESIQTAMKKFAYDQFGETWIEDRRDQIMEGP